MITKQLRQDAKAWAQDVIEDGRYRFHSCRHDATLIAISAANGSWKGFYSPDKTGPSRFVLRQFGFGDSPAHVYTVDYWRVVKHFELEDQCQL